MRVCGHNVISAETLLLVRSLTKRLQVEGHNIGVAGHHAALNVAAWHWRRHAVRHHLF